MYCTGTYARYLYQCILPSALQLPVHCPFHSHSCSHSRSYPITHLPQTFPSPHPPFYFHLFHPPPACKCKMQVRHSSLPVYPGKGKSWELRKQRDGRDPIAAAWHTSILSRCVHTSTSTYVPWVLRKGGRMT